MRCRDHTEAPYIDIIQHALQDVCTVLESPPSEAVFQEAVHTILQPGLYSDAETAVKILLAQGYVSNSRHEIIFTSTTSVWPYFT
jgi:hypothetical protein